jgi:hypothetical protein
MKTEHSVNPLRWPTFLEELENFRIPSHELASEEYKMLDLELSGWRARSVEQFENLIGTLKQDDKDNPVFLPFSLLGILHGTGLRETAHTRLLAWLFDPRQSKNGHELPKDVFLPVLEKLLEKSSLTWPTDGEYQVNKVVAERPTEKGRRVDIWVEGQVTTNNLTKFWLVVIEAKLEASLTDQLYFYEKEASLWQKEKGEQRTLEPCFVYLKDGSLTNEEDEKWIPLAFTDLFDSIWPTVKKFPDAAGYHLIRYYLGGILKDVAHWPLPLVKASSVNYQALSYLRSLNKNPKEGVLS